MSEVIQPYIGQIVVYFAKPYEQLPNNAAPTEEMGVAAIVVTTTPVNEDSDVGLMVIDRTGATRGERYAKYSPEWPELPAKKNDDDPDMPRIFRPGYCYPNAGELRLAAMQKMLDVHTQILGDKWKEPERAVQVGTLHQEAPSSALFGDDWAMTDGRRNCL